MTDFQVKKGADPSDGDEITKEVLHRLIDESSVLGIDEGNLDTDRLKMYKLSAPGSPVDGDVWSEVDSQHISGRRLKMRANSENVDPFGVVNCINDSGTFLKDGAVVVYSFNIDGDFKVRLMDTNASQRRRVELSRQVIGCVSAASPVQDSDPVKVRFKGMAYSQFAGGPSGTGFNNFITAHINGEGVFVIHEDIGVFTGSRVFGRLHQNIDSVGSPTSTGLIRLFK